MRKFPTQIADRHFHEIHHALGCPWPDEVMGETYRNYFSVGDDTETAARMRASSHWSNGVERFESICFHVTDEGRKALREYMLQNLYIPARYAITYRDYEGVSIHPARNPSAAKYAAYRASETDDPFPVFVREICSVRIHSRAINPHLNPEQKSKS